jgi:hypothetical protein
VLDRQPAKYGVGYALFIEEIRNLSRSFEYAHARGFCLRRA